MAWHAWPGGAGGIRRSVSQASGTHRALRATWHAEHLEDDAVDVVFTTAVRAAVCACARRSSCGRADHAAPSSSEEELVQLLLLSAGWVAGWHGTAEALAAGGWKGRRTGGCSQHHPRRHVRNRIVSCYLHGAVVVAGSPAVRRLVMLSRRTAPSTPATLPAAPHQVKQHAARQGTSSEEAGDGPPPSSRCLPRDGGGDQWQVHHDSSTEHAGKTRPPRPLLTRLRTGRTPVTATACAWHRERRRRAPVRGGQRVVLDCQQGHGLVQRHHGLLGLLQGGPSHETRG